MHSFTPFAITLATSLGSLGLAAPSEVLAQSGDTVFGQPVASVTYGPYVRLELGAAKHDLSDAYWLPPGEDDPRINFDPVAEDDWRGLGGIAIGYDWQNGFRADVSLFSTGKIAFTAPCSSASDGSPCDTPADINEASLDTKGHADITEASLDSKGVMASLFYAPMEARGSNAVLQPFFVAGLGYVRNEAGPWTRTNADSSKQDRTFAGSSSTDMAWSVGAGAALQLTRPGEWPVILEATYRYYDYGSISGGVEALDGGHGPRQGLTVDHTDHTIGFAIRVPLTRY